jgi:hypothetical protein
MLLFLVQLKIDALGIGRTPSIPNYKSIKNLEELKNLKFEENYKKITKIYNIK